MTDPENNISTEEIISAQLESINNLTSEKNSLLKIISHDIRGPFNQVFALLQLLEMDSGTIPDGSKIYIDKIYLAVIGGMEMVKNLNDSRGIDNGNITLRPEKLNVKSIIRQSIRNFSIPVRIKKMNIEFDESFQDIEIMADKILLVKVLDNVLSNAIKYSTVQSKIVIEPGKLNNGTIINIRDHGPGIPENELPMVFGKFQKLSPKPTMGEATTGLGLYNSRVFMKMMGGDIEVNNMPAAGLEVNIKI